MKLCISLMLCFTLGLSASTLAQQERVSLDLKNVSIKMLFGEIQKQTSLSFVFNTEQTQKLGVFSIHVNEETVESVLREVLKNTGMTFEFEGNLIIIRPEPVKEAPEKITLKGIVKDEKGELLPGVTIRVKGTTLGFVTNAMGEFNIELPKRDSLVLVFSFVGYQKQSLKVKEDGKTLKIVMKEESQAMEEVVVTGIFNKPKESFTGAVTAISKEELKANYSRNMLQTITNMDPSLRVVQNNSQGSNPNAMPEIQLRGASTLVDVSDLQSETRGNLNLPLFIMDGFEVTLERVMDLNENEVENITILKDAGATSLYGSRGANGVVVITSIRPKAGKIRVSYSGRLRLEAPDLSSYNMTNAKEKLEIENSVGVWAGGYVEMYNELKEKVDGGLDTDWLEIPVRTGFGQTHTLGIVGGDQMWRYGVDLSYDTKAGVMKGSYRNNFNGSLRLEYSHNKLTVSDILAIGQNKSAESPYGIFANYVNMNPYLEPYDENGEVIYQYTHPLHGMPLENPMYNQAIGCWNKTTYTDIRNTTSVRYDITETFRARATFGLTRQIKFADGFTPPSHKSFAGKPVKQKGRYARTETVSDTWQTRLILEYVKTIDDKHVITAGLNGEIEERNIDRSSFAVSGFANDDVDHFSMGMGYPEGEDPSGEESKMRRLGVSLTGNYYYDMRYFVDVNYRLDGSSSFGKESRFAPFFSVGTGWTISNESFIADYVPLISDLRVRYSYGVSGALGFSPEQSMSIYKLQMDETYLSGMGAYMNTFGNPNLKWQNTYQHNVGANIGLWNNRFTAEFNYYHKLTNNTITDVMLPISHGYRKYKANIGSISNVGYELNLSYYILKNLDKKLTWNITGRFSRNINTLEKISEGLKERLKETDSMMASDKIYYKYKEGNSMDAIYGLHTLGIDPSSGYRTYLTADGNITMSPSSKDEVHLGDRSPKVNGTISTSFSYAGISLNVGFGVQWGGKELNQTLLYKVENAYIKNNVDKRVLKERWKNPGDQVYYKGLLNESNTLACDAFIQKNNVFQCTNINVGYMFPKEITKKYLGMESLQLRVDLSDIFYCSTIKRERGTSYPYSINPNFSISCSF